MKIIRPTAVLDQGGGFSRASTATYYDSSGLLKVAQNNIPRVTFNPETLEHVGLLVEPSATNLILNSSIGTAQNINIPSSPLPYSLHFRGTGSVLLSGAYSATIAGTSSLSIASLTFVPTIGTLTVSVVGEVKELQIELGSKYTSYIPTTSSVVTRAADQVTGTSLVYSNLSEGGGTLLSKPEVLVTQNITVTNTSYVLSFTGTGTVTRSGASTGALVGKGVSTRVSEVFTPAAGTLTLTVSGTVILAQLEQGTTVSPYRNETAWAAATSYTVGQQVYRPTTHMIYENLQEGINSGLPEATPSRWLIVGPTNKWAVFDDQLGSYSTGLNEITYIIKPGRINSLALLELDAAEAYISLVANNEIVYAASIDLNSGNAVGDWYQYFYEPIYQQTALVVTNLLDTTLLNIPIYGEALLSVTLKSPNTVSCGVVVVGVSAELGSTQNAPTLGIIDYSRKEKDTFGKPIIVERNFSKRMNIEMMMKSSTVDNVTNILAQYRATPLVWVAADSLYTSLIIYGFYKDFDITIDNIFYSSCNIQIEGLT